MKKEEVEVKLNQCRLSIERGESTTTTWMGITVAWQRLAKRDGGTSKRKGTYGKYIYEYRDAELTFEQAINEIMKPTPLRLALIEAEAVIECSMCGRVVAGKEAMYPYQSVDYFHGVRHEKKPWGIVFWKMTKDEPEYLSFCPSCLQSIADGKYKEIE